MFHRIKKEKIGLLIVILTLALITVSCQAEPEIVVDQTATAQAVLDEVATEMNANLEPTHTTVPTITPIPTATAVPTSIPPTPTPELPVSAGMSLPASGLVIDAANADQVQPLAVYGKGTIEELSIAPDGQTIAVATISGISIYTSSNPDSETIYLPNQSIRSIEIAQNGEVLAAGLQDGRLMILNLSDGSIVHEINAHEGAVLSVAISDDSLTVASGGEDNLVQVWDLETGQNRHTFTDHFGRINDLDISPDNTTLASGSSDFRAIVWDIATGEVLETYELQLGSITAVVFSPDGNYLATGSNDFTTMIYNLNDAEALPFVLPSDDIIRTIAFAPDMSQISLGGDTYTVEVWELFDEEGTYQGFQYQSLPHDYIVKTMAYTPDGSTLIPGTWGSILSWWKLPERELTAEIDRGLLISAGFIDNEPVILNEPTLGDISLYNANTLEEYLYVEEAHPNTVYLGQLLPDNASLVTVSYDGFRIWDIASGELIMEYTDNPSYVTSLTPSLDGKVLAVGWASGEADLFDLETQAIQQSFTHGIGRVLTLAFSPDNNILATAGDDTVVRLWRITDGKEIASLVGHGDVIYDVEFSPDGETLATASSDYTVRIWQSINGPEEEWGNLITAFEDHEFRVKSVAYSPAGDLLASVSDDGSAILWNLSGGDVINTLPYFTGYTKEILFNAGGTLIYTWDWDGVMRVFGIPVEFN